MKEDVKEIVSTMYDLGKDVETCISSLQNAFIYNSAKPLGDCNAKISNIKELTKRLVDMVREGPEAKSYISVPAHLVRIAESLGKLSEQIEKKINDRILFSDKAVTEVTFLLQRLVDIIKPTSDIILAKNKILSRYVEESEVGVVRRANEYATLHEDRLIEGLYLNILDAIKTVAWHAKEIVVKITA
jgi:Na+/phosphate symporter